MDNLKTIIASITLIGIGILIGSEISNVYAKQQTSPLVNSTTMCKPTGSSQNDLNAEENCSYIYGKLENMEFEVKRLTSYVSNIHSDLEKHSGINTPLQPN